MIRDPTIACRIAAAWLVVASAASSIVSSSRMSLLAAVAVSAAAISAQPQDSVDAARAKQDVRQIITAVNLFRLQRSRLPTNDEGLRVLIGRYLTRVPLDPWGRPYLYVTPGRTLDYDVYTLGADGRVGGEGDDAEVGSWLFSRSVGLVSAPR